MKRPLYYRENPKRILFFAPHAGIWLQSFPEALIAESLGHSGYEISYITCNTVLHDRCVVMSSYGQTAQTPLPERSKTCQDCLRASKNLTHGFGFSARTLESFLSEKDQHLASEISQAIQVGPLSALKWRDHDFGFQYAYENLLNFKKSKFTIEATELGDFRASAKNFLLSFFAGQKMVEELQPDIIVAYNGLYSSHAALAEVARQNSLPFKNICGGSNLSRIVKTMYISDWDNANWIFQAMSLWKDFKSTPINQEAIDVVIKHFEVLLKGQSVFAYSDSVKGSTDLRAKWDVKPHQKLVLVSMSSGDERFTDETMGIIPKHDDLLFPHQIQWVKALISWAAKREDVFLVIRPHPREFPNKRENILSAHVGELEATLKNLPSNVQVNWPSEKISLYDLMFHVDAILNAWSSVGAEASLFGVPVVLYSDKLTYYPSSINFSGTTLDSYFEAIDLALKTPFDFERIRLVLRWYYLYFQGMSVDLSDSCLLKVREQRSFLEKVFYKIDWKLGTTLMQKRDLAFRKKELKEKEHIEKWFLGSTPPPLESIAKMRYPAITREEETLAIHKGIKKLLSHYDSAPASTRRYQWLVSKKPNLGARPAGRADSEMLLQLRNEPLVRANSLADGEVTREEHEAWLQSSFQNPNRKIFIVHLGESSVGMFRLDDREDETELSWSLKPEFRGQGLGTEIIRLAMNHARPGKLIAKIKEQNTASLRAAEKAGFKSCTQNENIVTYRMEKP